jgi:hypothetical protein
MFFFAVFDPPLIGEGTPLHDLLATTAWRATPSASSYSGRCTAVQRADALPGSHQHPEPRPDVEAVDA